LGITRNPWNLRITVGKLAASILARRPASLAIDDATKDCGARAHIRIPPISIVTGVILLRGCSLRVLAHGQCAAAERLRTVLQQAIAALEKPAPGR
jgi:hypothetical protein